MPEEDDVKIFNINCFSIFFVS